MKLNILQKDFKLKIVSLIIAIIVWFYIMGDIGEEGLFFRPLITQQSFKEIPVYVLQDASKVKAGFIEVSPKKISIKVRGKKGKIKSLVKEDLLAYIDLSHFESGQYMVAVQLVLPQDITLSEDILPVSVQISQEWDLKEKQDLKVEKYLVKKEE